MNDEEQAAAIARLREQWADATRRREVLVGELKELENWVAPIREAFGNPYFYSGAKHGRPENAEQSAAKYTGYASHSVVGDLLLPALRRFKDIQGEMKSIRDQLTALGEEV